MKEWGQGLCGQGVEEDGTEGVVEMVDIDLGGMDEEVDEFDAGLVEGVDEDVLEDVDVVHWEAGCVEINGIHVGKEESEDVRGGVISLEEKEQWRDEVLDGALGEPASGGVATRASSQCTGPCTGSCNGCAVCRRNMIVGRSRVTSIDKDGSGWVLPGHIAGNVVRIVVVDIGLSSSNLGISCGVV